MSKEMRLLLNIIRWILGCFFLICTLVYFNDGFALTPIIWFISFIVTAPIIDNKIKLSGIIRTILVILLALSAMTSVGQTNSYKNKLTQVADTKYTQKITTGTPQSTMFSSEYALSTVQNYHIQNDFPAITKGITISEMFEQMKEMGDFENTEWGVEVIGQDEYMVRFTHNSSTGLNKSKWRVIKDKIEAVSGYAITHTPELLNPTPTLTGNERDQEIFKYLRPMLEKYLMGVDPSDSGKYDAAEQRAIEDTAEHFGTTESEVKQSWFNVQEY